MFDFGLFFRLGFRVFSMDRKSLRFFSPRRIISAMIILPFFLLLLISNRFFMMLDWIFFPGFRKMKLEKAVFIVGVPRSATTYLLGIMDSDKEHFTGFKLWEILFAPSVIQKYILWGIIKFDRMIGRPFYKLSLLSDRIFLKKLTRIHDTGLSKPEEDEMLFLFAFASMYQTFFFPGAKELDPVLFFDEAIPAKKRKRLMLFYKRCLQRHNYVFNRDEKKYYLSKNPCFICKTVSLAETFPGAKLIYMLRSPAKTIPSTISLNENVYSIFSGRVKYNPVAAETKDAVIRWYKMADGSIAKNWQHKNLIVPFKQITKSPEKTVQDIYSFLDIVPGEKMQELLRTEQEKTNSYSSAHIYKPVPEELQKEISEKLGFVMEGIYGDLI